MPIPISVFQFFSVPPPFGGVSVLAERLSQKMSEFGHFSGVFCRSGSDVSARNGCNYLREPDLHMISIPFTIPYLLWSLRKYKIIHSHHSLQMMFQLWALSILTKKEIVVMVHNAMVSDFYERGMRRLNRFFLHRNVGRSNIHWVAVSDLIKREMEKLPVAFPNINVLIPFIEPDINAYDVRHVPPEILTFLAAWDKSIVLYGHCFSRWRRKQIYGYDEALNAFVGLNCNKRNLGLLICVNNIDDPLEVVLLKDRISSLGLEKNVLLYLKSISHFPAVVCRADCCLRPTVTDGDSLVVREALVAGVPVVASDVCRRPDSVLTYREGDVADLILKIEMALCIGKRNVEPTSRYVDQYVEYYRTLLSSERVDA